ncbi:MAG: DUF4920 domain-containing protein [Salibacteraceae bacterium]
MKKSLFIIPAIFLFIGCSETTKTDSETAIVEKSIVEETTEEVAQVYPYFAGEQFDRSLAISEEELNEVVANFDGNATEIVIATEITSACQKKGCWMTLNAGGEDVRVSFKDYDFFVPLDSEGHQTTVNGTLYYDTLTVEQLRHYAMDANASEDSIQSIVEPVLTLSYEATGVYVD